MTGCFYVNVNWDCTYPNMSTNSRLWNTRSVDTGYGVHLYSNSFYYLMQTRVFLTARHAIEANKYIILIGFKYCKRSTYRYVWTNIELLFTRNGKLVTHTYCVDCKIISNTLSITLTIEIKKCYKRGNFLLHKTVLIVRKTIMSRITTTSTFYLLFKQITILVLSSL